MSLCLGWMLKNMNLNAQMWFPHCQGQTKELIILIICPLINLMLSKVSLISTTQILQQERYAVILWTFFPNILYPTTIFPPHNVWPGHQRLGEGNPTRMESSTEKPTWSLDADCIFVNLLFPVFMKLPQIVVIENSKKTPWCLHNHNF